MRMPTLFVSHGAPDLVLGDDEHAAFLRRLSGFVPPPRAIVMVSAHSTTSDVEVGAAEQPATIHDFAGFPSALSEIRYACPGSPALAARIGELLGAAGLPSRSTMRGLDHGAWCPLVLAWPDARIPVVPLSVQPGRSAEHALAVGAAVASLRDDGVLLCASGGAVHNLSAVDPAGSSPPAWATAFANWLRGAVGDPAALARWRAAPEARRAHPMPEHFLPLLVAAGAGTGDPVSVLHDGWSWGSLAMTAFMWGGVR